VRHPDEDDGEEFVEPPEEVLLVLFEDDGALEELFLQELMTNTKTKITKTYGPITVKDFFRRCINEVDFNLMLFGFDY
jgi:hypothetical protein